MASMTHDGKPHIALPASPLWMHPGPHTLPPPHPTTHRPTSVYDFTVKDASGADLPMSSFNNKKGERPLRVLAAPTRTHTPLSALRPIQPTAPPPHLSSHNESHP
jgi:hypothetical protein